MEPSDLHEPEGSEPGSRTGLTPLTRGALWASLVLIFAAAAFCGWLALYAYTPGPVAGEKHAVVMIPRGSSVEEIAGLLGDSGLIANDVRFMLLSRIMKASARLPAGEFELTTGNTPVELISELVDAKPLQHRITIAEGLTVHQIADLFSADGWVDRERFVERASDPAFIAELGLQGTSLEGYLFPDTYQLVRPTPGESALIRLLVKRALAVWDDLENRPAEEPGLTRHEVFTLASIVEKETGKADERPLIASVFLNRLKRNMKLQSDPTVIYGIPDYQGPLTRTDLKTRTPYNTYQIPGLPPGPICSPGREALAAVLNPAESSYLYFVSKNDGSHQFSKSLREHNRAVRKYQR